MSLETLAKAATHYLLKERELADTVETLEKPRLREELAQAAARLDRELHECTASQQRASVRNILAAVDSSEPAKWAVDRAVELAQNMGAKITLVHVLELPPVLDPAFGFEDTLRKSELIEAGRETLANVAALVPPELLADRILREGFPDRQIVLAAEQFGADLIVIGTHSRGAIGRFLLGSTAEAVVRHSPCPVLTVSHPRPGGRQRPAVAATEEPAEAAAATGGARVKADVSRVV